MLLSWDWVLYFCWYIVKYLFFNNSLAAGCWFIPVGIFSPHTPMLKHILSLTYFSPSNNPRWRWCSPQEHCSPLHTSTPLFSSCVEKSLVLTFVYSRRNQCICILFSIRRGCCSKCKDSLCLPMPVACSDSTSAKRYGHWWQVPLCTIAGSSWHWATQGIYWEPQFQSQENFNRSGEKGGIVYVSPSFSNSFLLCA